MARSRGLEVVALAMACLPWVATLSCRDPHYILSGKLILTPFLQQKLSVSRTLYKYHYNVTVQTFLQRDAPGGPHTFGRAARSRSINNAADAKFEEKPAVSPDLTKHRRC